MYIYNYNDNPVAFTQQNIEFSNDFLKRFFEKEKAEFIRDVSQYKRNISSKELKLTNKQDLEVFIGKHKISDDFIEIDNINNQEGLKTRIRQNISRNDNNYNYYVVKATNYKFDEKIEIDKNNTFQHWFLLIQKEKNIQVIDSVGNERNDFFKIFVEDEALSKVVKYQRNEFKLQFSSGVCEIYSIKMAFYIARAYIFNKTLNRFDEQKLFNKTKKEPILTTLHTLFENGLNEVAFGENQTGNVFDRIQLLEEQIAMLKKRKEKNNFLRFTMSEIFESKFLDDLEKSRNILTDLYNNYKPNKEDYFAVLQQYKPIIDLNINKHNLRTVYDYVYDNKGIISNDGTFYMISKNNNNFVEKKQFNNLTDIISQFLFVRNKTNKNKEMLEFIRDNLYKRNKIDFSNPYTSVKLGHIYFESLRYQKELTAQQNVTNALISMFNKEEKEREI